MGWRGRVLRVHLVLSYSGGRSLNELKEKLGARRVALLYGSADFGVHRPVRPMRTPAGDRRIDLSYLGTWAEDRQRRSKGC